MATKYELTDDSIEFDGVTLYRVRALTNFGDVTAGDVGGYVDRFGRINIDDKWSGWVYDDAKAYGASWVHENSKLRDNAVMKGESLMYTNAEAVGNSVIDGGTVGGNCKILGSSESKTGSWIYGNVTFNTTTVVSGGIICGNCVVEDY